MLVDVLNAYAPKERKPRPNRPSGLSISGLFPCPYYLYKMEKGEVYSSEITAQEYYNMDDGWWQEDQSVKRLAKAGVIIEDRGKMVSIGKSNILGSIDGTFKFEKRRLWEHKAYDDNSLSVKHLLTRGIYEMPSQLAQMHGYMLGLELDEALFFVKIKNNNTYIERICKYNEAFINEIVEWADEIRLYNWKPEPKECKWCSSCYLGCFEVVDFSKIEISSDLDNVEKWKKGKQFTNVGKMLMEEADKVFLGNKKDDRGLIGDKDILILPGLEIHRQTQLRRSINENKVLELFGAEGLVKVLEEKEVIQYRHKEVDD